MGFYPHPGLPRHVDWPQTLPPDHKPGKRSPMGPLKLEKILKGSLDSIPSPSPSVKIQIMGGKVCLSCKGKTLLGDVNNFFVIPSSKLSRQ